MKVGIGLETISKAVRLMELEDLDFDKYQELLQQGQRRKVKQPLRSSSII